MTDQKGMLARAQSGFLGSLRDALAAAGREDATSSNDAGRAKAPPALAEPAVPKLAYEATSATQMARKEPPLLPPAAEAVREARAGAPNVPPLGRSEISVSDDGDGAPTTRVVRPAPAARPVAAGSERTQILRGKPTVARGEFERDPVVGWVVVVGGPGLGSFRPVFEGNNTVGRSSGQRVPVDFGDDAISSEEQAYIRYDSAERTFLFVPNLAKTNIVSVNGKRPTAAVPLAAMDVIQMGRTQLVFVPFCGAEFDWSELSDKTN